MFRKAVAAGAGVLAGVGLFALSGLAYPALPAPTAVERLQPGALPLPRMPDGGVKVDTTPVRLVIPSIKVDATIESRGLDLQRHPDPDHVLRRVEPPDAERHAASVGEGDPCIEVAGLSPRSGSGSCWSRLRRRPRRRPAARTCGRTAPRAAAPTPNGAPARMEGASSPAAR